MSRDVVALGEPINSGRDYMRENRLSWSTLGISSISTKVADQDKTYVLAEIALRRWLYLADLVNNPKTSMHIINGVARKNMSKNSADFALMGDVVDSAIKREASCAREMELHYKCGKEDLKCLKAAAKVYRDNKDGTMTKRVIYAYARAVCYSNIVSSRIALITALDERVDSDNIFRLSKDDWKDWLDGE